MLSSSARLAQRRVLATPTARRFLSGEVPNAAKAAREGAEKVASSTASGAAGAAAGGSNTGLFLGGAAAVAAVGTYFYMQRENDGQMKEVTKPAAVDFKKVRAQVADLLDDENHDDGSFGPVLVRLAWHNSGTWDKNAGDGGSEGAGMRFAAESKWGANAGLDKARARLEAVKAANPQISYSDLWILAANTAIEEMGGPVLPFRAGRSDKSEADPELPDGRLPDADGRGKAPEMHLRDIFYKMGMNDQEIVALSGAHALGRCHPEASGFWGPWTNAPTTFSNEYFRLLLEEKWTKKAKHEGKPWTGPDQFENKTGTLMMLPTDLSLIKDKAFKQHVEAYAKDEELFFKDFASAWTKLTENGCKNLSAQPIAA